ncbi:MAG: carboxypeptidase regulatory-like domain-containing protein [Acidobacteria bacterium]|nr:carboxypeptidase regulatory-like domain-containing protein [Acidobacteriota bacterium]
MYRLVLLACLSLVASTLEAQNRGAITGEVVDPSGLGVPSAQVTVLSQSIGLQRETTSNENGFFTVLSLPVGNYEVRIQAPGFKALTRSNLRLDGDQVLNLKFQMEIGQLADKVEVTSDAPIIETANGEVSRTVTMQQLQDFALAGRNSYYMLGIMPGVVSRYGNFSTDFRGFSFSMGGLQINGQRKDTNFITVDGISNTNSKDGVTQNNIVGVDFVEELKVATSHYAAEYGRTTGAQIGYTTRRGTQSFHASAFEFFLSEAFAGQQFVIGGRPHLRYHDFGATLGGPVYIPRKWNTEKNKLFFFVGFEGRRTPGFVQKFINVPTVAEKGGDFSASAIKPLDPSTGAPFPGNQIPTTRISAFGRYISKVYPNPNYVGPGGNYYNMGIQPTTAMDQIYRVDYNIKPAWQLSFRFMPGEQESSSFFSFNPFPLFQAVNARKGDSSMLSLTTSINPTTVNEFALGYSAYRETVDTNGDGAFRAAYGLSFPSLYTINHPTRIPVTAISGYATTTGGGYTKQATPTITIRENFSKVRGSHVLKAGVYIEQMSYNQLNSASDNGAFQFGSSAVNPKNSRNPFANALLGNADAYQEGGPPVQTVYKGYDREFYVQDSWRVSPRLSLEFGIRYSFISPWSTKWNNTVAFMPQYWDPAKAPQVAANGILVPGSGDPYNGLVMPGSGFPESANGRIPQYADPAIKALFRGIPEGYNPLRKTNFQPRASFAWDVFGNGKLSIRSGAGIFQGVTPINNSGWNLGARAPLTLSSTVLNASTDNPGAGIPYNPQTPIDAGSLPTDYKIPTVYNYSFGIQTLLPYKTALDVSYVGNAGRHLSWARPLNFLTPAQLAARPGVDPRPFLPYRGLNGISLVEPAATSSYNSLQITARRRTGDLTYSFAYTLGKIIGYGNEGIAGGFQNPLDIRSDRSELEESRRHNVVFTHSYELPWFKSQRGVLGRIAGGWNVTGMWLINSGRLYSVSMTGAPGQVASRPNLVGEWQLPENQRTLYRWFNTAAFARPAAYTYGNLGKWVLHGPGTFNTSGVALKNVRIYEKALVQFRIECFNVMNHMDLTDINTNMGTPQFGQIGGTSTPRMFQFGAKFLW